MKKFERQHALKTNEMSTAGRSNILVGSARSWLITAAILFSAAGILVTSCKKDKTPSVQETELSRVRAAIAPFAEKRNAIAAGYNVDVTGYRTHMGHHFLNGNLVDDKFEIDKPEVMLYAPYGSDTAKLVAVEYVTPIADLSSPPPVPEGFTGKDDVWEINTEFHLWTLHVWVGLDNTEGIFASHNHKLP